MRILLITQYFWPENFRINDLALSLRENGHKITVLTGEPNYPRGDIYKEYKTAKHKFNHLNDIEIMRIPVIPRGKSLLQLFFNYLSFAIFVSLASPFKLYNKKFDIIYVYQPSPISVGIPAILIKKIKKIPIAFHTLDLWPESLNSSGAIKSKIIIKTVRILVKWIYKNCDLILVQSQSFKVHIQKYFKKKKEIEYFPSWAEDIFNKSNKYVNNQFIEKQGFLKIVFAGNVGIAQDFPSVIQAAYELKINKINVHWIIVGEGRMLSWMKREVIKLSLTENFFFIGQLPLEEMPKWYSIADFLLLPLKPGDAYSQVIPGKLQSYMLFGKPILGMIDGEASKIISDSNSGLVSPAGDINSFINNIKIASSTDKKSLENFGINARNYASHNFSKKHLISNLEKLMEEIIYD